MRISQLVQVIERFLDFRIYPGFLAIGCLCGTYRDHISKGAIGGNPKPVGSYGFAERARHLKIVQRDDRPVLGFNPEGIRIVTGVRHREYSRRISFQQQIEINGHG
tara:strand:+ start:10475 stop:10792 length:318 start_codon:yes stop_codon:yes gene_type:complete